MRTAPNLLFSQLPPPCRLQRTLSFTSFLLLNQPFGSIFLHVHRSRRIGRSRAPSNWCKNNLFHNYANVVYRQATGMNWFTDASRCSLTIDEITLQCVNQLNSICRNRRILSLCLFVIKLWYVPHTAAMFNWHTHTQSFGMTSTATRRIGWKSYAIDKVRHFSLSLFLSIQSLNDTKLSWYGMTVDKRRMPESFIIANCDAGYRTTRGLWVRNFITRKSYFDSFTIRFGVWLCLCQLLLCLYLFADKFVYKTFDLASFPLIASNRTEKCCLHRWLSLLLLPSRGRHCSNAIATHDLFDVNIFVGELIRYLRWICHSELNV